VKESKEYAKDLQEHLAEVFRCSYYTGLVIELKAFHSQTIPAIFAPQPIRLLGGGDVWHKQIFLLV
jgi:hypothetical protein